MGSGDKYTTLEAFVDALKDGREDRARLRLFLDGLDFFIMDEGMEVELFGGDERDVYALFFEQLGIREGAQ